MNPQPFCSFAVSMPGGRAVAADVEIAGLSRARALLAGKQTNRHAAGTYGADAAEYLQLAVKRWRYYFAEGFSPRSLPDAKRRIADAQDCELGFLLTAGMRTTPRVEAGFCFLRRVWTGRFVVDFLSIHPSAFDTVTDKPGIRGVGAGLLASAAKLTLELDGSGFWGEATKHSHGFYQAVKIKLSRNEADNGDIVTDHFRFEGDELQILADTFLSHETA